jgi:hypothetical protein
MTKYLLAWIPMVLIAIVNGLLRQAWYGRHFAELQAHQLSTLIGALLLGVYMKTIMRHWKPVSAVQAITIGMAWCGLTVVFEFLFGHFVAGHSWTRLLQDYDLLAGRVWSLLLVWVLVAPYFFYRLRK